MMTAGAEGASQGEVKNTGEVLVPLSVFRPIRVRLNGQVFDVELPIGTRVNWHDMGPHKLAHHYTVVSDPHSGRTFSLSLNARENTFIH